MAAAGFAVAESPLPSKPPVHRPPGVEERGGGEAGAGPAAPECGAPGLWSPLAAGPGRATWRATRCACRVRRQGALVSATVVDHVVPHRGDPVLFWDESNWQSQCKPLP